MKTILVVDDEPKIADLARDYLEHAGFTVRTAADGMAPRAVDILNSLRTPERLATGRRASLRLHERPRRGRQYADAVCRGQRDLRGASG